MSKINKEILTGGYEPQKFEKNIYQKWENSGYFNPDKCIEDGITNQDAEHFSVVLPPPNVTGTLHVGHAYEDTIQDTIVRYHRMKGDRTLWIPGTDSAAIATQARVEKNILKDEGKTRYDLGREELVKRVYDFAKNSENTILNQVRQMGASLDWSRYAYALDEKRNLAVNTAFVNMYKAGLIYQGDRIVNWDPKGQTTISDDEIVYEEEKTKFYYFKYGPFTIGTARPETKFGDKYVVMHPEDKRYLQYKHGDKIIVDWINGEIQATIIKDEVIDMEFGTGVMTITPWHSKEDFELAKKYNLEYEQIIDKNGKLLPIAGEFSGIHIKKARPLLVEKLRAKGFLVKEEGYTHNIATAERTGEIIEPQIMKQWWIAVDKKFKIEKTDLLNVKIGDEITLKEMMKIYVESGVVNMDQEGFRKTYLHWCENLEDWCISRQIWFGHRIPVWYKDGEVLCDVKSPTGEGWEQESDVLDTWFSSALWTFSTLGWPEQTGDLQKYHTTSFMSPAYEILSLWVSRMVLMSGFHLGQAPFKIVKIHGLVRDVQGRKFSKSLNNGIDPLDMIKKYGTDALRMGLMSGVAIGGDIKFSEDKVKGYKHFANKIWNITKFLDMNGVFDAKYEDSVVSLKELNSFYSEVKINLVSEVTKEIENFNLHLAADKLYQFIWKRFADEIIEESKVIIQNKEGKYSEQDILDRKLTLRQSWEILLKLLHPFMPFVTEVIWSEFLGEEKLLMVENWPKV